MSQIYIHKASNKYVIFSIAIVLYLSIMFIGLMLLDTRNSSPEGAQSTLVLELNPQWNNADKSKIIFELTESYFKDKVKEIKFIDKAQGWKMISGNEIPEFQDNPLNDVIFIKSSAALQKEKIERLVSDKSYLEDYKLNVVKTNVEKFSSIALVLFPLLLISLLFSIIITKGASDSNLSSNKKELQSLILAGAKFNKINQIFRNNALKIFLFSFIFAIVLCLLTLYLIIQYFDLNPGDLGTSIIFKSIFVPSLLLFVCYLLYTHLKVDKYIKSI